MGREWTDEQKEVIKHRGRSLLVSAAAGSGKTSVLVERIINLVTDPIHPVDIDRLLVVTFTRAAAGEMKSRLTDALAERLAQDPDNEHLQQQSVLIHHAQITTIHGFCSYVIQNYFQQIDIDPGYRIAEEGELRLLREDVMNDMLEEEYAEGRESFLAFIRAYASGKNDADAAEMIQSVYNFSMAHPYPDEWLDRCLGAYQAGTAEEIDRSAWMKNIMGSARLELSGAAETAHSLYEEAVKYEELEKLAGILSHDEAILSEIAGASTYAELRDLLFSRKPDTWRAPRKVSDELSEIIKHLKTERDSSVRAVLKKLKEGVFQYPEEQVIADLNFVRPYAEELVRLVKEFAARYAEAKRERNVADFSDLEHFALAILEKKDDSGQIVRTDAAKELSARFEEVMVDEYQDSSFLQEAILSDVSGEQEGRNNRFMVGDIKQSIYGFRMAQPSLFLDKFEKYQQEDSGGRRIDLGKNFRSRPETIDSVNAFFRRLMIPELGGIRYDASQALYRGQNEYPGLPDPSFAKTELLLVNRDREEFSDLRNKEDRIGLEAQAVATKILSMVNGGEMIYDGETKKMRPVRFRDCVILLRSVQEWADIYVKVLQDMGIPAYSTSKSGYFSAPEVKLVLDYLTICDNPQQDIPYAAVLRSPIGGLSDSEMAEVRIACPTGTYYYAVQKYLENDDRDPVLLKKLRRFDDQLESMRRRSKYTPVHLLISQILEETGYGAYAAAMPGGQQRQANLSMLSEKAVEYESTSYHGVFNFVRYIEKLQKYQIDYGEVNICGPEEDTVRVMTIHKSKGLEFPIVFIAGLGKQFNNMDEKGKVIMHADLGIGLRKIDPVRRTKSDPPLRLAIRKRRREDMLGEELRILYVAMTRAEQKLILVGTTENEEKLEDILRHQTEADEMRRLTGGEKGLRPLRYDEIVAAKSYLDWIGMAVPDATLLSIREMTGEDMVYAEAKQAERVSDAVAGLRRELSEPETAGQNRADKVRDFFHKKEAFRYPYEKAAQLPAKMTVTEIKKRSVEAMMEEKGIALYPDPDEEEEEYIPDFMKEEKEKAAGAARGTIYHSFFEHLDYRAAGELERQISELVSRGIFSEEDAGCLKTEDFERFLETDLGKRMAAASLAGTLHREQPFVLDVCAKDIDSSWPADENILVQGTIDAYFSEDDGGGRKLVIVDYKTDRIRQGDDGSGLVEKYATQLQLYKKALVQITGTPVKELWIYSVTLGKAIPVPDESGNIMD